jgi:hypothetical protein
MGLQDIVRVLRVIEYTGPREWVEDTVSKSLACKRFGAQKLIRSATIGTSPEILTGNALLQLEVTDNALFHLDLFQLEVTDNALFQLEVQEGSDE